MTIEVKSFDVDLILPKLVKYFNSLPSSQRIIQANDFPVYAIKVIGTEDDVEVIVGEPDYSIPDSEYVGEANYTWVGERGIAATATAESFLMLGKFLDFRHIIKSPPLKSTQSTIVSSRELSGISSLGYTHCPSLDDLNEVLHISDAVQLVAITQYGYDVQFVADGSYVAVAIQLRMSHYEQGEYEVDGYVVYEFNSYDHRSEIKRLILNTDPQYQIMKPGDDSSLKSSKATGFIAMDDNYDGVYFARDGSDNFLLANTMNDNVTVLGEGNRNVGQCLHFNSNSVIMLHQDSEYDPARIRAFSVYEGIFTESEYVGNSDDFIASVGTSNSATRLFYIGDGQYCTVGLNDDKPYEERLTISIFELSDDSTKLNFVTSFNIGGSDKIYIITAIAHHNGIISITYEPTDTDGDSVVQRVKMLTFEYSYDLQVSTQVFTGVHQLSDRAVNSILNNNLFPNLARRQTSANSAISEMLLSDCWLTIGDEGEQRGVELTIITTPSTSTSSGTLIREIYLHDTIYDEGTYYDELTLISQSVVELPSLGYVDSHSNYIVWGIVDYNNNTEIVTSISSDFALDQQGTNIRKFAKITLQEGITGDFQWM